MAFEVFACLYSNAMFEILAYVFENYVHANSVVTLPALQRQLFSLHFDQHVIERALLWLQDLKTQAHQLVEHPVVPDRTARSMRILASWEQKRLGTDNWAYLCFLQSIGKLSDAKLELVLDRVTATPAALLSLQDLKLIILMVYWSLNDEPDDLLLDELCDSPRTIH